MQRERGKKEKWEQDKKEQLPIFFGMATDIKLIKL